MGGRRRGGLGVGLFWFGWVGEWVVGGLGWFGWVDLGGWVGGWVGRGAFITCFICLDAEWEEEGGWERKREDFCFLSVWGGGRVGGWVGERKAV